MTDNKDRDIKIVPENGGRISTLTPETTNGQMIFNTVLDALKRAQEFIENGVEYGYIEMPGDICDSAHETLPAINNAIPIYKAEREELEEYRQGKWYAGEDIDRMVRELDVALNGEEGAAKQALLCDIYPQLMETIDSLKKIKGESP